MKAIQVQRFGGPEELALTDTTAPKPKAGQVRITVKAAGVNPVDTYIRTGTYPLKPTLPYTPGMDCAGLVDAVGEGVTGLSSGDRVYTSGSLTGTYAETTLCSADQAHPLPDRVTFPQGAALGIPYATAYHALFHKAKAQSEQTVLIHGATGGVGTAAIQLAQAAGLTVLATAGTESGLQLCRQLGVDHVLDHHDEQRTEQIMALTQQQGVDIVLEMLANLNLAIDLEILAQRGAIVIVGNRGTIEINPRYLMARDASIQGMLLMNASEREKAQIYAGIHQGLEKGALCPVIDSELPLASAGQAHQNIIDNPHQGKIVLIP